jgi:hypothetical protein
VCPQIQVVSEIERELVKLGANAVAGPLWLGTLWIVVPAPVLYIFRVADLVGMGVEARPKRAADTSPPQFRLYFWIRGEAVSKTVDVSESAARAAAQAVKVRWRRRSYRTRLRSSSAGNKIARPASRPARSRAAPRKRSLRH